MFMKKQIAGQTSATRAGAYAVMLVVAVLSAGSASSQTFQRLQVGDLWDANHGYESPIGLQGMFLVWPGGSETASSLYEGGFRTNSTGAMFRLMFKDYLSVIKDSLGNVVDTRTIPFYHPSYAAKTPTEAYRPTTVKWVRTYRTPTVVTYEDGSVHQNTVDRPGPTLIEKATLPSDEMVEYTEFFSDGFYVKQYYYAWANRFHDDYVIRVVDFVNNGNLDDNVFTSEMTPKALTRLYLDLYVNNLSPNNKGEGFYSYEASGNWDNWHDYRGDTQGDTLRFMYACDGDDPNVPGDDQGDPYPSQFATPDYDVQGLYSPGEFISAMYAGYGVLYADQSATVRQNDPAQPFVYGYDNFSNAGAWREELRWVNVYNSGTRAFKHPDYSAQVPKGSGSMLDVLRPVRPAGEWPLAPGFCACRQRSERGAMQDDGVEVPGAADYEGREGRLRDGRTRLADSVDRPCAVELHRVPVKEQSHAERAASADEPADYEQHSGDPAPMGCFEIGGRGAIQHLQEGRQ